MLKYSREQGVRALDLRRENNHRRIVNLLSAERVVKSTGKFPEIEFVLMSSDAKACRPVTAGRLPLIAFLLKEIVSTAGREKRDPGMVPDKKLLSATNRPENRIGW